MYNRDTGNKACEQTGNHEQHGIGDFQFICQHYDQHNRKDHEQVKRKIFDHGCCFVVGVNLGNVLVCKYINAARHCETGGEKITALQKGDRITASDRSNLAARRQIASVTSWFAKFGLMM